MITTCVTIDDLGGGLRAHVAARAVIVIEAEDPVIGLMAFVAVGMSEVSSCLIGPKVTPGYHVGKGEELGYFQYGGSTHCLVFRPGAIAEFALAAIPQPHDPKAPLMLVRSARHRQHGGLRRGGWPQADPEATARPLPITHGTAGHLRDSRGSLTAPRSRDTSLG